ncbi:MAG: hypothetical protein ACOC2L_02105 [Candidatus Sumerlaeota bacterium]
MRRCLQFLVAFPLLISLPVLTACSSPLMEQSRQEEDGEDELAGGAFQIDSLRARIYLDDTLYTLVEAEKARLDFATRETRLRNVLLRVMQAGETRTSLESETGIMYMADRPDAGIAKNDVLLEGDVVMKHGAMRFELPGVRYNSSKDNETFVSQGDHFSFRLDTANGPIISKGTTMRANRALSEFTFYGPGKVRRLAKNETEKD